MGTQKRLKQKPKIDKKSWQRRTDARRDARELVAAMREASVNYATLEVHNGKRVEEWIVTLGHHLTTALQSASFVTPDAV